MRTFLQVAALSLTLGAALFLARGTLGLSPQVIVELAVHQGRYNRAVLESLAQQAADTQARTLLLVLAFGLQLTTAVRPTRWMDLDVSRRGLADGLVFALLTCGLGYVGASMRAKHLAAQAVLALDARVGAAR